MHMGMTTPLQIVFLRKNAVCKDKLFACNIHFTSCFKCKIDSFYHPWFDFRPVTNPPANQKKERALKDTAGALS